MIRFWRGIVGAVVLALAIPVGGCTSLLGDFSSGQVVPKEAGTAGDATAGDDVVSSPDASMGAEAGGEDDASSTPMPDASGGCGPGQMRCAAGCVSLNDVHTCGDCNNDCTTLSHVTAGGLACTSGVCTFTCSPGYAHCPSSPAAGCETNLSAISHCGSCTTVCDPDGGTPFCAPSGTTYACSNGCPPGTTECGGSCSDLTSDDSHCGDCGTACTGGMTCQSGQCACPAPLTNCGGTCFETDGDPTHCGAGCLDCTVPSNGTATCSQGSCGMTCNANYSACTTGTACQYNTQTDATHCGASCTACPSTQICSSGVCKCPVGKVDCAGTGFCSSTLTDANNCGSCGNVCPDSDPACKSGVCSCIATRCGSTMCGCGDSCCKVGGTLTCC